MKLTVKNNLISSGKFNILIPACRLEIRDEIRQFTVFAKVAKMKEIV